MKDTESPVPEMCRRRMEAETEAMRGFRKAGGKVLGYLCQGFPPAVAAGLGMWPVRVLQGVSTAMEDRGAKMVRPDVCPLVKSFLGAVASNTGIFGEVDVWAGLATCDQTRRAFAELPALTGACVIPLQLPSTAGAAPEAYYGSVMERFCRDAALVSADLPDYDPRLALEYAADRGRAGAVLADAALSGMIRPLDMHWMFHVYHIARPRGLDAFLSSLTARAGGYDPVARVALAGSSLALEDVTALRVLQDYRVSVIPLQCSGLQSAGGPGLRGEPLSGCPADLAEQALRSVRCARSRPNDSMFDYLEQAIIATGSSGLVVKTMRFCDLWNSERERLRERMPVPVMVLDTTFSEGEAERQVSRLEAFLETLIG